MSDMLDKATRFGPFGPDGVYVEKRIGRDGDKWAITDGANVLDRDGKWQWEPQPSSRTDEFIAATRFSREEAFDIAMRIGTLITNQADNGDA